MIVGRGHENNAMRLQTLGDFLFVGHKRSLAESEDGHLKLSGRKLKMIFAHVRNNSHRDGAEIAIWASIIFRSRVQL